MSYVTTIILTCALSEERGHRSESNIPAIIEINAWLEREGHPPLASLKDALCGQKVPQAIAFGLAFNYLGLHRGFIDTVKNASWREPSLVRMLVNDEYESGFSCWTMEGWAVPPVQD